MHRRGITSGSAAARWAWPAGDTAGPRYDGVRGVHPAQLKHPAQEERSRGPLEKAEPKLRLSQLDRGPGLSLSLLACPWAMRVNEEPWHLVGAQGWEPWACW